MITRPKYRGGHGGNAAISCGGGVGPGAPLATYQFTCVGPKLPLVFHFSRPFPWFLTLLSLSSLAPAAQSLSLSVSSRLTLSGPPNVSALAWRPQGGSAVCLGARLLLLDAETKLERSLPTGGPCVALAVSPAGDLLATLSSSGTGQVSVWHLPDAQRLAVIPTRKLPVQIGFRAGAELLIAGPGGLESVKVPDGTPTILSSEPISRMFIAPNGQRAVVAGVQDGQRRIELLNLSTLKAVSAVPCAGDCQPGNVVFSADGQAAAAYTERTLYALRDSYPSSTLVRNADNVSGLPLNDGSVLTFNAGQVETRDLLTGRRERTLAYQGVQPYPAQLSAAQRVLALSTKGELLDANTAFTEVKHLPLPAQTAGGGLDTLTGNPLLWLPGGQALLGNRPLKGTYWALQSMNKSTWALISNGDGGLALVTVTGGQMRRLPSQASHTRLSVNHWGNYAATWDADTLQVVSQASGKVTATFTPTEGAGLLDGAQVTLSPDGTRAFVFPAKAAAFVVTLQNGKRFPLPVASGFKPSGVQISGKGTLAYTDASGVLSLYRQGEKKPYLTTPGQASGARFSPDSLYLAVPGSDERGPHVDILNADSGKIEATTPTLADQPTFLAWSADNKRLMVGAGLMDDLNSATVFELK